MFDDTDSVLVDYTSAVLATMAVLSVLNWFVYARKHYHGANITLLVDD